MTITMLVTGLLMVFLAFSHWHWRWWQCVALGALFLAVDLAFLGANALKIYPDQSTVGINQLSVGTAVSLSPNTGMKFKKYTATLIIAFLSA